MPALHVVVASVRKGRAGLSVAEWFVDRAREHGQFDAELIDLATINLPLLDEPNHPRLQNYERDTTKAWGASVQKADAFVFVTPEYNHGSPPALINALDHVYVEWNYKPAAFVSYGGISGGTRSVQMTKQILLTLKMVPIVEAVNIPFFTQFMAGGAFKGTEAHAKAAATVLGELRRWTDALKALR